MYLVYYCRKNQKSSTNEEGDDIQVHLFRKRQEVFRNVFQTQDTLDGSRDSLDFLTNISTACSNATTMHRINLFSKNFSRIWFAILLDKRTLGTISAWCNIQA